MKQLVTNYRKSLKHKDSVSEIHKVPYHRIFQKMAILSVFLLFRVDCSDFNRKKIQTKTPSCHVEWQIAIFEVQFL